MQTIFRVTEECKTNERSEVMIKYLGPVVGKSCFNGGLVFWQVLD